CGLPTPASRRALPRSIAFSSGPSAQDRGGQATGTGKGTGAAACVREGATVKGGRRTVPESGTPCEFAGAAPSWGAAWTAAPPRPRHTAPTHTRCPRRVSRIRLSHTPSGSGGTGGVPGRACRATIGKLRQETCGRSPRGTKRVKPRKRGQVAHAGKGASGQ